jgi:hypothetical protein
MRYSIAFLLFFCFTVAAQAQFKLTPYLMGTRTNIYFTNGMNFGLSDKSHDPETGFQLGARFAMPISKHFSFVADVSGAHHRYKFNFDENAWFSSELGGDSVLLEKIQFKFNAVALRAGFGLNLNKFNVSFMGFAQINDTRKRRIPNLGKAWELDNFAPIDNVDAGVSGLLSYNFGPLQTIFRYDLGLFPQNKFARTDELGNITGKSAVKTNSFSLGLGYTFGE